MDEYHEQFSADEKYPDFSDINTTVYAHPPKKHGRELARPMGSGPVEGFNFVPSRASARTAVAAPSAKRVEKMAGIDTASNIIEELGGINAFIFLVLVIIFTCCYMIHGLYAVNRELAKLKKLVKMMIVKT